MDVLTPRTLDEAVQLKAAHPDALPTEGGTDVMVELNFARSRPEALLDLTRVAELTDWNEADGRLPVGAGVSYARASRELGSAPPALAMASRTVGSPQIRNRGTIGGNLGSSSPAGDALPPLYASEATVELASVRGARSVPIDEFIVGPKRNVLAEDELIAGFSVPRARGPQQFSKIGTRNAMVIAVCSFALELRERSVGTCIGSAAPSPRRAVEADALAAGALDWDGGRPIEEDAPMRFAELVAEAASPIDDVRGSSAYRRHALGVLSRRSLTWAWEQRCA